MPGKQTSARRVYAALMVDEATDVSWDEAIRRWSRADDERDPASGSEAESRCQVDLHGREVVES